MTYGDARKLLDREGQGHVLKFWDGLDAQERASLLSRIEAIDFRALARMRSMLGARASSAAAADDIRPALVEEPGPVERAGAEAEGARAIAAGRVGVLLVAGGQGSRLGFDGPKGIFPIGPVSNASLFEIHARKVLALERRHNAEVPLYIMTSEANDGAARRFFAENGFFGMDRSRVIFFVQGMWPALDAEGLMVLEAPGRLFLSPDGHGGILSALDSSGAMADMRRRGLETLFYFQVDNPMVEVADPVFIGMHRLRKADISVKVCPKRSPGEGLGVVVKRSGRNAIVEYSELTDAQKNAREPDGRLRFLYGSVAIHVFALDFLEREAGASLPLHVAHKKVPAVDGDGRPVRPSEPNAFKFEKFIFDVIPDAARVLNLAFAREDEFSPVKNAEGEDSPATARRDMTRKFGRWLTGCGVEVPLDPSGNPSVAIEIDPCYALGPDELKARLPRGFRVDRDIFLRERGAGFPIC